MIPTTKEAVFNTRLARFGAVASIIKSGPCDDRISFANARALTLIGDDIYSLCIQELFQRITGDPQAALFHARQVIEEGTTFIEGEYQGRMLSLYSVVDKTSGYLQASIFDVTENHRIQDAFKYTANALARASEANDDDTGEHIIRINWYSKHLSQKLGMNDDFIEKISILAQLHDVGKIHIDPRLLKKPGRYTREEFDLMKSHTWYGEKIIGDHPSLDLAREIALSHHEKWDGSGYPRGLKGNEIPISARIVSIVDVFDALLSPRVYKPSFPPEKVYRIFTRGDDRMNPSEHFDPQCLSVFLESFDEFIEIYLKHKDPEILVPLEADGS